MSTYDGKVTKDEAIALLVLENMSLKKAAKNKAKEQEEKITTLLRQIGDLEEEKRTILRDSLHHSFFEKQIKRAFENSLIPIPKIILEQKLPISSTFTFDDTSFDRGTVGVYVTFSSGDVKVGIDFVFTPTLWVYGEGSDNYPDFKPAVYIKPVITPVKKVRKPATKTLKPTPLPTVKI